MSLVRYPLDRTFTLFSRVTFYMLALSSLLLISTTKQHLPLNIFLYFLEGPFTVLAPNNAAFEKIDPADLEALLADKEALTKVLLRHVIAGKVVAADVTSGPIETVGGEIIEAEVADGSVTFTNADGTTGTVIIADIEASNGVAHALDTVI